MKKIKLTKGKYALVDDVDYEFLNQWKWHLSTSGYAKRNKHIRLGTNQYTHEVIWMHRLINQTPEHLFTDHINQNKLDNRKANLRNTNKSLNSLNRSTIKTNKSGFYGVHFDSWSKKWRAEIRIAGKRLSLGRFNNIKDAVLARRNAEAKINFYAI
jgi:hypothetical protein